MNGTPFSFADCEATFGAECVEWKAREAREAPRFTPEQILAGRRIFATFRVPAPQPAREDSPAADAA
ncbi:hypothetical protein [Streptomyces antibioticus]|uniref:hypothetical protein n=1 Tax=Streptomyces antibioticus TaxID=1890 RepID=UPI0033D88EA4